MVVKERSAAPKNGSASEAHWAPIPPNSCTPDGSLRSTRVPALGRSRAKRSVKFYWKFLALA